ncbi:cytochrome D1 domain-containing protein [Azospirillum oleiclasticum]|nr:cytochrome D1 domain-containing protein [Azospirillum oleiclasticum]
MSVRWRGVAAVAAAFLLVGATDGARGADPLVASLPPSTAVAAAPAWMPDPLPGGGPARLAVVLNSESDSVSVINGTTMTVSATVPVGKEPHHWMVSPDGRLIVANTRGDDLVYIDRESGRIQERRGNIVNPYLAGYSPDQRWLVVNGLRLGHLDIYRAGDLSLVKRIVVGGMPSHLAFDADSRKVFVTLQGHDELAQVDLETQAIDWRIKVGDTPAGVLLTPDGNHLLVGVMGQSDVAVVEWRKAAIVGRIPTGKGSHNILQVPGKPFALVSNRSVNTISVIDQRSFTVVDTIGIPGGPDCMMFSPDGRQLWVTARWRGKVHVYDPVERRVVMSIPVGRSPHGVYVE